MSAVYRAYDTVMGREVALKRLLPVEETNLNEAAGEALAREAAALAQFSHPNVVTIFAFEEDAEGPYVVMELVEGEDLHSIMKSGALSWEDFRDVAGQCLEPLVAAAELNLLHRDIKPGNIMLTVTASGRFLVKVLDFGLSKFSQQPSLQTLDQRGSFLGSIDFIAPEQLELRPLDQRTDLYSLGCVYYYMLAQKSPFSGGNPAETSMNHLGHRCQSIAERRSDVPALVADWIMRLISRDPDDRPSDAREALTQYQDALRGIPYVRPGGEEEVPFAEIVAPAATGPVGPPGDLATMPAAPSVEAPKAPLFRSASEPLTAMRRATGPLPAPRSSRTPTGRQSPLPPATDPQRPPRTGPHPSSRTSPPRPGASGPQRPLQSGSARSSPRGGEGASESGRRISWKWIGIGVGGALLGFLAILIFAVVGEPSKDEAEADVGDASTSAPPRLSPLSYPVSLATSDGRPEPPVLPGSDSLCARFVSEKGVFGRDYSKPPAPGGFVAAWRNLMFPEKERSLLRDGGDPNGEYLPILREYGSAEIPGLARRFPGLTTTNRTALTMLRHQGVLPKGFTLLAVVRLEAGDDRLVRIQPPVSDGRFFAITTGYDGKVAAVFRGKADGPELRTSIPWKSGSPGILVAIFDPVAREQRISARLADGTDVAPAKGMVDSSGAAFGLIAIGKRGFSDSFDTETGNVMFELVVYDRVLNGTELQSVSDALAKWYFLKTK